MRHGVYKRAYSVSMTTVTSACSFYEQWVTACVPTAISSVMHRHRLWQWQTDSETSADIRGRQQHKRRRRDRRHTSQRHERLRSMHRGSARWHFHYRIALVPCGRQRFCDACMNDVERQGRGCPICCTDIQMILRLFWRSVAIHYVNSSLTNWLETWMNLVLPIHLKKRYNNVLSNNFRKLKTHWRNFCQATSTK